MTVYKQQAILPNIEPNSNPSLVAYSIHHPRCMHRHPDIRHERQNELMHKNDQMGSHEGHRVQKHVVRPQDGKQLVCPGRLIGKDG